MFVLTEAQLLGIQNGFSHAAERPYKYNLAFQTGHHMKGGQENPNLGLLRQTYMYGYPIDKQLHKIVGYQANPHKPIKSTIYLKCIFKENSIKWEDTTENIRKGMYYILIVNDNRVRRVWENRARTSRMTFPEFLQLLKPIFSHDIAVSL